MAAKKIRLKDSSNNKMHPETDASIVGYTFNSDDGRISSSIKDVVEANSSAMSSHIANTNNPHNVTKSQVGLGNVTDDAQVKRSEMGTAGGVATLDASGKVPSAQLPSYVDDVIEGYYYSSEFYTDSTHNKKITPDSGKIYVDMYTNKTYRWGSQSYVEISSSLALGETDSTAYRGDFGKIAYDHSQANHAPVDAEANQNAFSTITISGNNGGITTEKQKTFNAGSAEDTLTFYAGDNISITTNPLGKRLNFSAKDTTYDVMGAASSTKAGTSGLVPAPASGKQSSFLRGDGTWAVPTDTNTDTKVNVTLNTDIKAYLMATSTVPTSTATAVTSIADTGVYLGTTAGELVATKFTGELNGNASTATSATTATKASQDGSGNSITETYMTKVDAIFYDEIT